MTPRKPGKSGPAHPVDWTIEYEWTFERGKEPVTIESRVHDVKVDGAWYQFDRFVTNHAKGVSWLDCFEMYPLGGFRAHRPGEISAVRVHVEPKKPANATKVRAK